VEDEALRRAALRRGTDAVGEVFCAIVRCTALYCVVIRGETGANAVERDGMRRCGERRFRAVQTRRDTQSARSCDIQRCTMS
jgi:hypothetical protein